MRRIAENAGFEGSVVVNKVKGSQENAFGFNAATGLYGDLVDAGIMDPTKVSRIALVNAASVAALLTTRAMIAEHSQGNWLAETPTRQFEVRTIVHLEERWADCARTLSGARALNGAPFNVPAAALLKVLATGLPQAAVPTPIGLKFLFPADLRLFSARYTNRSPAQLARASMSVPLFFEPLLLDLDSTAWSQRVARLADQLAEQTVKYLGAAPSMSFVDGGLLSNFPIDAFLLRKDCGDLCSLPTVGVALAGQPQGVSTI